MPRGRPSLIRYFLDQVTGSVVAVGAGGLRVLQEIGGKAKPTVKRRRRRRRATAATMPKPETPKKRGRPRTK